MIGNKILQFVKMARFHFIIAGFLLFCTGALYAVIIGTPFQLDHFCLGYAIFFLAHLSVHYSNDYFDRDTDQFGIPGPISGGSGVLRVHPEFAIWAKRSAITLIVGSITLGIIYIFLFKAHWWFLLFVLAGNLMGWFYSAPPIRLSYRGLGEIATATTIGFLIPGMGYLVMKGSFDFAFMFIAIPFFFFGYFFITSVEIPDMAGDQKAEKWTLVARKGRQFGLQIAVLATILAITSLAIPILVSAGMRNLFLLTIFSVIPLCSSIWGLVTGCKTRQCIVLHSCVNIATLVVFVILTDLYFLFLAATS